MTLFAIAVLAVVAGLAWFGWRQRRAGKIEAERDALSKLTEAQRDQLDAAMRAPVDKRELVDRLREKGL